MFTTVCEDRGLVQAVKEKRVSIGDLLSFSSVCGVGLDTVPVPGYPLLLTPSMSDAYSMVSGRHLVKKETDEAEERLRHKYAGLLLDMTAMAFRLQKPLSVRLLPEDGKSSGERTHFNNPYLIDTTIMEI